MTRLGTHTLDPNALAYLLADSPAVLGVSARTARRLIERGELTFLRIAGRSCFSAESARAYVKRQVAAAAEEATT